MWEAFKIFWDRLPEQDEYQSWMNQCQEGTVSVQDIGSYFTQSEEHQALVKQVCMYSTDFIEVEICVKPDFWQVDTEVSKTVLFFQRMSHSVLKR